MGGCQYVVVKVSRVGDQGAVVVSHGTLATFFHLGAPVGMSARPSVITLRGSYQQNAVICLSIFRLLGVAFLFYADMASTGTVGRALLPGGQDKLAHGLRNRSQQ